jgi:hypothetical protein
MGFPDKRTGPDGQPWPPSQPAAPVAQAAPAPEAPKKKTKKKKPKKKKFGAKIGKALKGIAHTAIKMGTGMDVDF